MEITKDNLTWSNVKSYLRANVNMTMEKLNGKVFSDNEQKQLALRHYLCKECIDNGKCVICKCKTPDLFYDKKRIDSKGRWKQMLDDNEWNTFLEYASNKLNNVDELDNVEKLAPLYTMYYKEHYKLDKKVVSSVSSVSSVTTSNSHNKNIIQLHVNPQRLTKQFGDIKAKTNLSYTFSFPNTTKYPLSIEKVNTSCGCTTSNYDNTVVKPGAYMSFTVHYDTNNIGSFRKNISPSFVVHDCDNCFATSPSFVIEGRVLAK